MSMGEDGRTGTAHEADKFRRTTAIVADGNDVV
jgi:hypothetical protein